ncbi:MAG: YdcF family protein [Turneriella sp.]|nr:YdcF family protein [Turneriella sp.]
MRRFLGYLGIVLLLAILAAAALPFWMAFQVRGQIYTGIPEGNLPHPAQVALVPGASVLPNKRPSATLLGRLRAGLLLYQKQLVPRLLLSGDGTHKFYDEVQVMQEYCLRHGVKPEDLLLDREGVRTYDTMARAHHNFGVRTAIVVSQELYLPRALFLAKAFGIKAEGFVAEPSSFDQTWQAAAREYFARLKSLLDVFMLKLQRND